MQQRIPLSHYETTGELCRKIEVFTQTDGGWSYLCTTQWHKTLRAAKERYCLAYGIQPNRVKCQFKESTLCQGKLQTLQDSSPYLMVYFLLQWPYDFGLGQTLLRQGLALVYIFIYLNALICKPMLAIVRICGDMQMRIVLNQVWPLPFLCQAFVFISLNFYPQSWIMLHKCHTYSCCLLVLLHLFTFA